MPYTNVKSKKTFDSLVKGSKSFLLNTVVLKDGNYLYIDFKGNLHKLTIEGMSYIKDKNTFPHLAYSPEGYIIQDSVLTNYNTWIYNKRMIDSIFSDKETALKALSSLVGTKVG